MSTYNDLLNEYKKVFGDKETLRAFLFELCNEYNIDLYLKSGEKIELTGFLDTGNKLTDPYKKRPIILINKSLIKDYYNYNLNNILLVPYDSLNHQGILKCIVPDKIFIQGIGFKKNFLIGISNEKINIDGIDCILSQKVLEGK